MENNTNIQQQHQQQQPGRHITISPTGFMSVSSSFDRVTKEQGLHAELFSKKNPSSLLGVGVTAPAPVCDMRSGRGHAHPDSLHPSVAFPVGTRHDAALDLLQCQTMSTGELLRLLSFYYQEWYRESKRRQKHEYLPSYISFACKMDQLFQHLRTRIFTSSNRKSSHKDQYKFIHNDFYQNSALLHCRRFYAAEVIGIPLHYINQKQCGCWMNQNKHGQQGIWTNPQLTSTLPWRLLPTCTVVHVYGSLLEKLYKKWRAETSGTEEGNKEEINTAYWLSWLWKRISEKSDLIRNFASNQVMYLNPSEAAAYEVAFNKHSGSSYALVYKFSKSKRIRPGIYMFVLDASGKHLYIGTKQRGTFHHTSFVSGAPVQCAGMVRISSYGLLADIYLHSGHYRPTLESANKLYFYLSQSLGSYSASQIPIYLLGKRVHPSLT